MQGADSGINRRELLAVGGRVALAIAVLPLAGCLESEDAVTNQRLSAALRAWIGEPAGARWIAAESGITVDVALRMLRGNASNRDLAPVLADEQLLRHFIIGRRSADLREGRTRPVRGWWLSETEVAVAVLMAE